MCNRHHDFFSFEVVQLTSTAIAGDLLAKFPLFESSFLVKTQRNIFEVSLENVLSSFKSAYNHSSKQRFPKIIRCKRYSQCENATGNCSSGKKTAWMVQTELLVHSDQRLLYRVFTCLHKFPEWNIKKPMSNDTWQVNVALSCHDSLSFLFTISTASNWRANRWNHVLSCFSRDLKRNFKSK